MDLALLRALIGLLSARRCVDEGGAGRSRGVVLSRRSSLPCPPPTASRRPRHFPVLPVIDGASLPASRRRGAEEALPAPMTTFRPFHSPYAGGFLGDRSRLQVAFRGLRPLPTGSAPPWSLYGMELYDVAGFASCCGPAGCSPPLRDFVAPSTAGSLPPPRAVLPRTLASPRAGLSPAGCPELVRLGGPSPPSRNTGRTGNQLQYFGA